MGIFKKALSDQPDSADRTFTHKANASTPATTAPQLNSEQEYRHLFETSPIPYVLAEEDGTVVRVNEAFRKEFFCPVTEDGPASNLWHKLTNDATALECANKRWQQRVLTMRFTGAPAEPFEQRVHRLNGESRFVIVSCAPLTGRQRGRLLVTLHDITERRQKEKQIEELSQRLLDFAELERAWLARELHETIGQELSALKLALQHSKAPAVRNAGRSIDELLNSLRLISDVLRPPVLELLGLEAALEELLGRLSEYREIQYRLEFASQQTAVSAVEKIGLYRIAEQCLYAIPPALKSPEISISLRQAVGAIEMLIRIQGAGSTQIVPLLDEVLLRQRASAFGASLVTRFSESWSEILVKTEKNNQLC